MSDRQALSLMADIGLTKRSASGMALAPCGTPAAYRRHLKRGEPVDAACREAANRARRGGEVRAPERLKPIAHGEPRGYRQHKYRGEDPCEACREAERLRHQEQNAKRRQKREEGTP